MVNSYFSSRNSSVNGVPSFRVVLARIAVFFYLLVLPFAHNAALKYLAMAGMALALIWSLRDSCLVWDWRSPVLQAVLLILGVFAITSLVGTAPMESLNELRKHFLPCLLFFALVPTYFRRPQEVRWLLVAALLPFILRGGLALGELAIYADLDQARQEGAFLKGFSMDATLYAPLLLGAFLLGRGKWRLGSSLGGLVVLAVMLAAQSRTPVVAAMVAGGAMLVVLRAWRGLLGGLALLAVSAALLAFWQPAIAGRFASTLDPASYAGAQGMSARAPIWKGVIEISQEHPWLGHGFGWKKLGRTAVEHGYVARWQAQAGDPYADLAAWYFSLPTEKVNPHNLALEVFFEGGALGLASYAVMLAILLWQAWTLARRGDGEYRTVAAIGVGYLAGHVVLSASNGLWIGVGPTLLTIALLEVCRLHSANLRQTAK